MRLLYVALTLFLSFSALAAPILPFRTNSIPQMQMRKMELESTNRVLLVKPKSLSPVTDINKEVNRLRTELNLREAQ